MHTAEQRTNTTDLSNFKEEDREDIMAIRFPTNMNKTEDLANRVVCQNAERFKNKQKVMFGGSKTIPIGSPVKLARDLSNVSVRILAYACYLHEGLALLRRLSRSAFITT